MTNKISGYSNAEPIPPLKGSNSSSVTAEKAQAEAAANAPAAQTGDQVTLTNSARSLQKIEEKLANTPAVDSGKVAAMKQSIGSGTYKIDAGRTADKLMLFERGLK